TMGRALNEALRQSLAGDDRTLVFGEDVGKLGGVFRVTEGLQEEFGERRVFDTPLAESGIAGISVGLAMAGWKPVVEMQFDAFSYPALNQVISHVAKYRNRTRGRRAGGHTRHARGGDRPPVAGAAGPGDARRVRPPNGPSGGRARGAADARARRRGRGAAHGGMLRPPRGARAARDGTRHPVSA